MSLLWTTEIPSRKKSFSPVSILLSWNLWPVKLIHWTTSGEKSLAKRIQATPNCTRYSINWSGIFTTALVDGRKTGVRNELNGHSLGIAWVCQPAAGNSPLKWVVFWTFLLSILPSIRLCVSRFHPYLAFAHAQMLTLSHLLQVYNNCSPSCRRVFYPRA